MFRLFLLFFLIGIVHSDPCVPISSCEWINWLRNNYNSAGMTLEEVNSEIASRNCGGSNVRCSDESNNGLTSTSFSSGGGIIGGAGAGTTSQCALQIFYKNPFGNLVFTSPQMRLTVDGRAYRFRVHGSCCWLVSSQGFLRSAETLPSGYNEEARLHPRSVRPVNDCAAAQP